MLLTSLLRDKQARWEVDTMVYGIPSHLFVTKQQSCLLKYLLVLNIHFNYLSALLEYLDLFKPFFG